MTTSTELPEYELAGIETIARGVAIRDGKLLVCKSKGGVSTYLPGGHIEFGETGREALKREMMEEAGVVAQVGAFLGVVESKFIQHDKPHAEINLVYKLDVGEAGIVAKESWIEFEWKSLDDLDTLLPEIFRKIGIDSDARFEV